MTTTPEVRIRRLLALALAPLLSGAALPPVVAAGGEQSATMGPADGKGPGSARPAPSAGGGRSGAPSGARPGPAPAAPRGGAAAPAPGSGRGAAPAPQRGSAPGRGAAPAPGGRATPPPPRSGRGPSVNPGRAATPAPGRAGDAPGSPGIGRRPAPAPGLGSTRDARARGSSRRVVPSPGADIATRDRSGHRRGAESADDLAGARTLLPSPGQSAPGSRRGRDPGAPRSPKILDLEGPPSAGRRGAPRTDGAFEAPRPGDPGGASASADGACGWKKDWNGWCGYPSWCWGASYKYFLCFGYGWRYCYSLLYGCSWWYWNWWYPQCGYYAPIYRYWPFCYFVGYRPYVVYSAYGGPALAAYGTSYGSGPPCAYTIDEAWGLLGSDTPEAAYDAFACLAAVLPGRGSPLVGLSLAAAALGRDDEAVQTMRSAVEIDARGLDLLPDTEGMNVLLSALVERYEADARRSYGDLEALFMVSALRYLLGEIPAAHYAIDVGITLGDDSRSALALRAFIEELLRR